MFDGYGCLNKFEISGVNQTVAVSHRCGRRWGAHRGGSTLWCCVQARLSGQALRASACAGLPRQPATPLPCATPVRFVESEAWKHYAATGRMRWREFATRAQRGRLGKGGGGGACWRLLGGLPHLGMGHMYS